MGARTRRRGRAVCALLCFVASTPAMASAVAAPASAAPTGATGATGPKVVHLRLKSHQAFTRAGVKLKVGDSVSITTSGTIVFGGGLSDARSPGGIAWGKECDAVFKGETAPMPPWPAPGLRCWSMIAKVGAGAAFEVGTAKSFRATDAGPLLLGINDNFVRDNKGHWFATVKVNAPRAATTPTTPAPAKKHSSNSMRFVLVGALLLAVVVLIVLLARRRRDNKEEPELAPPAPAAAPIPKYLEHLAAPAEVSPLSAVPTGAAPHPESIDVNIFEVEFNNGLTLRVGYNHFPEGTDLRWKVTQNRIPVATGRFVAKGGGSTNHFETVPLGIKLEGRDTQPDGADVQFDWTINDVPFRYSVRRDPNC